MRLHALIAVVDGCLGPEVHAISLSCPSMEFSARLAKAHAESMTRSRRPNEFWQPGYPCYLVSVPIDDDMREAITHAAGTAGAWTAWWIATNLVPLLECREAAVAATVCATCPRIQI
ncbi:hypothetical protein HYS28_00145, partial [Candidatus Uhrbacteria bacterium]|nr:hypothetical protein [Candidatus Uhrbacteria bacterium]